jgi:hypothetical protein
LPPIFFSKEHAMRRPFLALALSVLLPAHVEAAPPRSGRNAWCGSTREGARDAVWAHRERRDREGLAARSVRSASFDRGDIAVLLDEGDLSLVGNVMDLQRAALRFSPTADGYSVSRIDLPPEPDAGARISLTDDDSEPVALGFAFPFYGRSHSEMFVNSDGNVTFGERDDASTERSVGRLVNGPARAAPLLADLDPEAGGSVSALVQRDHATVTWNSVPQFGRSDRNTFQMTLWADGRIDFLYDQALSFDVEGVVGIAPGAARGGLTAVDFSAAAAVSGGAGSLAESFRAQTGLDTVAVARKFYATHPDEYQQLIVYTSQTLVGSNTFAYELSLKNADAGIGAAIEDSSADFGSGGRLESFVMMDALAKYPDDLSRRFLGEDSALSVLGHEVGHRWLANARFKDGNATSRELLGRDQVHWSFFFDSDGSFLEGNDIEPQPDGSFRTVGAALRYSALDQYLMGLRDASEVPPFFFVRSPTGAGLDPGRDPQSGVVFGGTRRDVAIADVIAALGPRDPPGAAWPRPFRQAFVYVAVGGAPDTETLDKLERIRAAWPAFFSASTESRGSVDPSL